MEIDIDKIISIIFWIIIWMIIFYLLYNILYIYRKKETIEKIIDTIVPNLDDRVMLKKRLSNFPIEIRKNIVGVLTEDLSKEDLKKLNMLSCQETCRPIEEDKIDFNNLPFAEDSPFDDGLDLERNKNPRTKSGLDCPKVMY